MNMALKYCKMYKFFTKMFFLKGTNDINKKMPVNTFCDSECSSLKEALCT